MTAPICRKIPDALRADWPAVLVGSTLEIPNTPDIDAWVYEFVGMYLDGRQEYFSWIIRARFSDTKDAKYKFIHRAERHGLKTCWIYSVRRPPTPELQEQIINFNRDLEKQKTPDSSLTKAICQRRDAETEDLGLTPSCRA